MDNKTFNAECRKLNIQYRDIFEEIPCMQDYSCTREEYISAMQEAIRTGKKTNTMLRKAGKPLDKDALI